jgi:hypothetical protein
MAALLDAPDKYVKLDLSGSTITTIPKAEFSSYAFLGGLRGKFYVTNSSGGTPGT